MITTTTVKTLVTLEDLRELVLAKTNLLSIPSDATFWLCKTKEPDTRLTPVEEIEHGDAIEVEFTTTSE